jgi:hypothetical protein
MLRKVVLTIAWLVVLLTILSACGAGTDSDKTADSLRAALDAPELETTDLIAPFFRYYRWSPYELSMLPEFDEQTAPDWDELTIFVWLNHIAPKQGENLLNEPLTQESFSQIVHRFMPRLSFIDRSSSYLQFQNGVYTSLPGDTMRSGYFRLLDIQRQGTSAFAAVFDVLYLGESGNETIVQSVQDSAGKEDIADHPSFEEALLTVLQKEDYAAILPMSERVRIEFSLSGDKRFPFYYQACSISKDE